MKKIFILAVVVILFGALVFTGLEVRDQVVSKNYLDYWQERSFDAGDFTYVVLGDATGLGVGATDASKSYVGLLLQRLKDTGKSVKIINLSVKDADISNVMSVQLPKIGDVKPDLVTITVGMKDINSGISLDDFEQNARTLFSMLPQRVSYVADLPHTLNPNQDKIIKDANFRLTQAALSESVTVVPLYEATKHINDMSIWDWGLRYPNDTGYKLWADTFWATIQQ